MSESIALDFKFLHFRSVFVNLILVLFFSFVLLLSHLIELFHEVLNLLLVECVLLVKTFVLFIQIHVLLNYLLCIRVFVFSIAGQRLLSRSVGHRYGPGGLAKQFLEFFDYG